MKGDKMKGNEERVVFIAAEHPGMEKKQIRKKGDCY
jgi:hypothetical protein